MWYKSTKTRCKKINPASSSPDFPALFTGNYLTKN
jgi:hypothetical protein